MTWTRAAGFAFVLAATSSLVGCGDDSSTGDDAAADDGSTGDVTSTGGSGASDDADSSGGSADIMVSGDAFAFTLPGEDYGRIDGATITILEQPELTTTTDAMGHFVFEAVPPGSEATFVLERDGFPVARTKTFTIPTEGELSLVTFQVPNDELFDLLAGVLELEIDPAACQIVSTVTRVGKSLYDDGAHGEAEATVTLTPAIDPERGPVYFNAAVIPDPMLVETSEDGGVLFTNVPPGVYTMEAHKDGVSFESTTMKCDAGVLVNASPPYGLQAL